MNLLNTIYKHFKNESLYRNSIYLMASTGVLAVSGFVFWLFVARLFNPDSVGIATTLISVSTLIGSFSLLGLNVSIITYVPKSNEKNNIINASFTIAILASIIVAIIFILGLNIFSPQLLFLQKNIFYILAFIIFMIGFTLNSLMESTYTAFRAAGNILIKNSIASVLKVLFIFVFIYFGAFGIFGSFSLAVLVSVFISAIILIYKYDYRPKFSLDNQVIKKLARFSIANYVSGFLYQAPSLILPLIVLNHLHAKAAAYYYIDTMILNLLIIIPVAASQSLLTEGSHNITLMENHIRKAVKITTILLVPAIFIVFFFGHFVLYFFGHTYETDAFRFLQIVSLSSVFMSVVVFGNAILRIHHKIKPLIFLNIIGCLVILITTYYSLSFQLVGLGWGWTIAQALVAAFYLWYLIKTKNISFKKRGFFKIDINFNQIISIFFYGKKLGSSSSIFSKSK